MAKQVTVVEKELIGDVFRHRLHRLFLIKRVMDSRARAVELDDDLRLVTGAAALLLMVGFVCAVRWRRRFWRFYDHLVQ